MNRFVLSLVAGSVAAAVLAHAAATPAATEGKMVPLMASFTDLKWTELPERIGMQFAVLSGDPKVGQYTELRKVLAGTDNPLHSHSSEITNVIISGVWYTGVDAESAKDFGPGSVVMMPANWVHVSGCRAGSDCVLYQDGKGKFDYKPVTQPGKQGGGLAAKCRRTTGCRRRRAGREVLGRCVGRAPAALEPGR